MYSKLIGLPLAAALEIIGDKAITILHNDSNKLKEWDSELIVRCKQTADGVEIILSHFKLAVCDTSASKQINK